MLIVADPCLKSLYLVADTIVVKTSKFHGEIHSNVYPVLAGVGYICGLKIATLMFAGSLLGWIVIIPMIHTFGQDAVMFPAKITIGEIWENAGAAEMVSALAIGAIVCIVVALSGDMVQDLKTGYILGATPQKQQVGEFIGGTTAVIAIGFIFQSH